MSIQYVEAQLMQVCPLPVNECGIIRIQIISEKGKTKWMNITPDQFKQIENVLLGIHNGKI